ncbi:hypothetical protein QTO34_006412 [Cnephaeus nilssonii]|uniref:Uncharacterized protein n=1 Tax=Cnephaeus nilssonii TaxID=3371016 RepID=A0AA40LGP0_CNENI|nr:hypothetical protein QTO34_006412 [Eptesicus nilssonii]
MWAPALPLPLLLGLKALTEAARIAFFSEKYSIGRGLAPASGLGLCCTPVSLLRIIGAELPAIRAGSPLVPKARKASAAPQRPCDSFLVGVAGILPEEFEQLPVFTSNVQGSRRLEDPRFAKAGFPSFQHSNCIFDCMVDNILHLKEREEQTLVEVVGKLNLLHSDVECDSTRTLSSRRRELSVCAMAAPEAFGRLVHRRTAGQLPPRSKAKAGELARCLLRHKAFRKPPLRRRLSEGLVHQRTASPLVHQVHD